MTKLRVAVIYGGRSSEHAISCVSAGSVMRALPADAWEVVSVGITRDGTWVLGPDPDDLVMGPDGELPEVAEGRPVTLRTDGHLAGCDGADLGAVDVVFPVMHGPWGQDGTLQGLLEMCGLPYVGAGVLASALGTDKAVAKDVFRANGIPVMDGVVIRPEEWPTDLDALHASVDKLGYPVFVKPARGGSSFGISRVEHADDLVAAIEMARTHDPKVVIEAGATGVREIEIGVLSGPDGVETSAIAEICVGGGHAFYDFEAKYLPGQSTDLVVPADLPADVAAEVSALAKECFCVLGLEGLSRVDFFLGEEGSLVVNEVETMPGFTATSMFPAMWAASGVDYPALVDRLVRQALARPTGLR